MAVIPVLEGCIDMPSIDSLESVTQRKMIDLRELEKVFVFLYFFSIQNYS